MEGYEQISRMFPAPQYQIGVVHGQMHTVDKNIEMERFKAGETHILVATTVIEVGVDVPNASVMVIESAERFGLSQLHQLRGRVGRGAEQSYCILMTGEKVSSEGRLRMKTMVDTNDGFKISEVDMNLRGAGDISGTQQSGMMSMKLADIVKDQHLLVLARNTAQDILANDPTLEQPEHEMVQRFLDAMQFNRSVWSRIS
jgi:ATP-dependent DNA helicase RecG